MVLAVVINAGLCSVVQAGISGDAELLKLIANGNRINQEQVHTWKGTASVVTTGNFQDPNEMLRRTAMVRFAYDAETRSRRWNYQFLTSSGIKSGVVRESTPDSDYQETVNGMFRDGAFYRYRFHNPKTYNGARTLVIAADKEAYLYTEAGDFDPFLYLNNDGSTVSDELMKYYGDRDNPELTASVSRDGDIVTITTHGNELSTCRKFSLSMGYSLVETRSELTKENGKEIWTSAWVWQSMGGVFTPVRIERRHDTIIGDSDVYTNAEITFDAVVVNEAIDASEFALEALGLQPGDRVQDGRTGAVYTYQPTSPSGLAVHGPELKGIAASLLDDVPGDASAKKPDLPLPASIPASPDAVKPSARPRSAAAWVLAGAGGVLLAVVALALIRKAIGARHS